MILLQDITKIYDIGETKVRALNGVSLEINEGEFISIMGPSGCGKTTLLNIVGCIDKATNGKVFLNGRDVSKLTDRELTNIRLRNIGFIFQQFYLIPTLNAYENIELPMKEAKVPKEKRNIVINELFKIVRLTERAKHFPSQLSGGEQQRVCIARALCNSPKILLADEPTGELDSETGKKILDLLEQLNKEKNLTIILVTHNINVANRSKRIVKMLDGKIVSDELNTC